MFAKKIFFLMFILSIINSYSQVKVREFLPKNYVEDGSIDYTLIIQGVLDKYDNLIFPNFPLMINEKGLYVRSNTTIRFENGGKLVLKPNSESHYAMIMLEDVENVRLYDVVLEGDKDLHLNDEGEWGMGIYIKGGIDIIIKGGKISNCWGDGIDIVYSKSRNSEKINVSNLELTQNRRNGVTIGSGNNIILDNLNISYTGGTLPMAGICIEPNNNKEILNNIIIKNINSHSNGIGLSIGLMKYPGVERRNLSINISNLNSINDGVGILYGDYKRQYEKSYKKLDGYIKFKDIEITNSTNESIKLYSHLGYDFSPIVSFNKLRIKFNEAEKNIKHKNRFVKNKIKNILFEDIVIN